MTAMRETGRNPSELLRREFGSKYDDSGVRNNGGFDPVPFALTPCRSLAAKEESHSHPGHRREWLFLS
jgi:hypothetical protein